MLVTLLQASTEAEQLPRPSHMQSCPLSVTAGIATVDQVDAVDPLVVDQPYLFTKIKSPFQFFEKDTKQKHKATNSVLI